jgi:Spy/CpxP family protein refolding chaperone
MKRFKMFSVMLVSLVMITTGLAFAKCSECKADKDCVKCEKMEKGRFDKMSKELKLNDTQKEQVKAHREKHHTAMKDTMKQLREKEEALKQELQKENTDKSKVEALKSDIKELNAKRIDGMVDAISEMKQILTPEQQKIMNTKMNKMHDRSKSHDGKKEMHKKDGQPECDDMNNDGPPPPDK